MSEVGIYQDSKGMGTCRSCGKRVEWAEVVKSGKRMPFNPPIVGVRVTQTLPETGARIIEWIDTTQTLAHFATCPQAKDWRRPR